MIRRNADLSACVAAMFMVAAACAGATPTSLPVTPSPPPTPSRLASARPALPSPTTRGTPTSAPFTSSERLSAKPLGSETDPPLGYLEYLPPGYGDGAPWPLLLYHHGSDESGDGRERDLQRLNRTGIPRLIARDAWPQDRPFIVLMPQHEQAGGSFCTEGEEITDFLEFAQAHYDVAPERIYLTGVSCGAIGAWEYLAQHTDEVIAAAVLLAGDGREAFAEAGCALGRVPIWAFHGEADVQVDVEGSSMPIEALQVCDDPAAVDVRVTTFPSVGHAIWNPIYDLSLDLDVYRWLLGHTNSREAD